MTVQYVLGGILIALAIFLCTIILKQTGKEKGLSGTITGSADTYFGKNNGSTRERILAKITVAGSVLFVILTIVLTILIATANNTPA